MGSRLERWPHERFSFRHALKTIHCLWEQSVRIRDGVVEVWSLFCPLDDAWAKEDNCTFSCLCVFTSPGFISVNYGNTYYSGRLGVWLGSRPVSFIMTSSQSYWTASSCNYCSFSLMIAKVWGCVHVKRSVALKLGGVFSRIQLIILWGRLCTWFKQEPGLKSSRWSTLFCEYIRMHFSVFQTHYLEIIWVVSRCGLWISRLGVAVTL